MAEGLRCGVGERLAEADWMDIRAGRCRAVEQVLEKKSVRDVAGRAAGTGVCGVGERDTADGIARRC